MSERLFKLHYFVPESHLDATKKAILKTGAGRLGDYDYCAWHTKGVGQFRPLAGSQPFIGNTHQIEKIVEFKVEIILAESCLSAAVAALKASHPFEHPAFELVQVYQSVEKIPGASQSAL